MTRALVWHWKIVVVSVLAVGLIAGLTLGIQSLIGKSSEVLAAELASNSPEVQDILDSEVVEVLGVEVGDDKALVICTDTTGNSYVVVEVNLKDKDVTKVTYPAVGEPYLPNPQMESEILQTITNELSYALGEEVTIDITNISRETITGGGVYFAIYDLDGNLLAGDGLFLAFEWEPDEGFQSFTWDQTNEHGEQVAPGTYVILGKAGDYSDATLIHIS